jgi:hypothetical protein
MRKIGALAGLLVAAIVVAGCTKPEGTNPTAASSGNGVAAGAASGGAAAKLEGPAAAVQEFLEALRTGDDGKATRMLTAVAREKTATMNRNVTPPASDTARFAIGQVEHLGNDAARVACTWTDFDEEGKAKTDEAIWVLRREQEGWRVAGVAAKVFPGEPPLVLSFEDPEDMFRKQQWVREEIRRRMEGGGLQAQDDGKPEKPVRR